jgi:hypothetical protein
MVAVMTLAVTLTVQRDYPQTHVRTTEAAISTLIESGMRQSPTFRRLVETLDGSDVIVSVGPKITRSALGGFLQFDVAATGGYRYLRIALEMQGTRKRLVPILAHELQHAVEVAQHPEVRNGTVMERLFARLAIGFGCTAANCVETSAAMEVEEAVQSELKAAR